MVVFGLMIGIVLMLAGWATHTLAPRVGPNPVFGLRTADTLASREAWERSNRVGGLVLGAMGAALIIVTLTLRWLRVDEGVGMSLLVVLLLVLITASTVGMVFYSRRLGHRFASVPRAERVAFRWRYLAAPLGVFILSVVVAAIVYPRLPAGALATHFDLSGEPSGWMGREATLLAFLGIELLLLVMNAVFVWVGKRQPSFPSQVGRMGRWRLSPEQGLTYMGFAFAFVQLTILVAMLDSFYFNLAGGHLVPMGLLLALVLTLSLAPIVFLIAVFGRGRDNSQP